MAIYTLEFRKNYKGWDHQIWHAHVADDYASPCAKVIFKKFKERVIFYFFAENRSNFEGLCTPIPSLNFFLFYIYDGK